MVHRCVSCEAQFNSVSSLGSFIDLYEYGILCLTCGLLIVITSSKRVYKGVVLTFGTQNTKKSVVYFDQCLRAVHSNCWLKYAFSTLFVQKS